MIIRPKHFLVSFVGLILAFFIFYVNSSWGNDFLQCFYISLMTFLLWLFCWSLYFELRDFWQFRWYGDHVMHDMVDIAPISIPIVWDQSNQVKPNILGGEIIHAPASNQKMPVVIFVHGFSDNSNYIRHFTIPIAIAGYDIVAYDSRGTKKSRKAGKKNQFSAIAHDLEDVITFIQSKSEFKDRPIYLVGLSLGAVAAISQGLTFQNKGVEKVVGIASIGNFLDVLPSSPIPFKKSWWYWLRYKFFGVSVNPLPEINYQISPLLQFRNKRSEMNNDKIWKEYTNSAYFLIHAKNDPVIKISHFYQNMAETQLDDNNWLVTNKGGHNFLKNELIITSAIINKLNLPE